MLREKPTLKDAGAEVDVEALIVRIDPKASLDVQRGYLWHECMHIAWEEADIPARAAEETVARRLGPALVDIIRNNPILIRFLLAGGK